MTEPRSSSVGEVMGVVGKSGFSCRKEDIEVAVIELSEDSDGPTALQVHRLSKF